MAFDFPDTPSEGAVYSPISGLDYVFSGGAWLQRSPLALSGPITGATFFNSKAQATVSTIASDVPTITLHGYATPGDGGGGRYNRVASEPAHLGKFQSADGAWWELKEFEVTLEMFGGKPDGIEYPNINIPGSQTGTDNWPAFMAAFGYGRTPTLYGYYSSSAPIRLLRGIYAVAQTIQIQHHVSISGVGPAPAIGNVEPQSRLVFPPNTIGFRFWSHISAGAPAPGGFSYASLLENIKIIGQGGTLTYPAQTNEELIGQVPTYAGDITKHGIMMHDTISLRNLTVQNFAGDGINATTTPVAGSANILDFTSCRCVANGRNGIFIQGGDTNAGGGIHMDTTSNGGWGMHDSCFLNNTWTASHSSANGWYARVHWNGGHYVCNHATLGGSTTPGTDPNVWELYEAGGRDTHWPEWKSGDHYIPGGAYYLDHATARILLVGCYSEGGQGISRMGQNCQAIGGLHATPFRTALPVNPKGFGSQLEANGVFRHFTARRQIIPRDLPHSASPGAYVTLGSDDNTPVTVIAVGDNTSGLRFPSWNNTTGTFDINHGSIINPVAKFSTDLTVAPADAGRGPGLLPGNVMFPNGIFMGSTLANTRMLSNAASIPTVGPINAQGDIVFNSAPTSGENVGWICVQGGMGTSIPVWPDTAIPPSGTSGEYGVRAHCKNSAGRVYRLIFDPVSQTSVVEPTHTFTFAQNPGDGYVWTYAWRINGTTIPADWATGVYAQNAMVKNPANGCAYRCTTVGGGASTIVPSHEPKVLLPDAYAWDYLCTPASVPLWVTGTTYKPGDIVKAVSQSCHRLQVAGAGVSTDMPRGLFAHSILPAGGLVHADNYKWEYLASPYTSILWEFGFHYLQSGTNEWENRIINAAGHAYRCITHRTASLLSTVEPVHTSGDVTGTDGHTWRYVTNTTAVWKTFGLVDA